MIQPCTYVIFGATGNLFQVKLMPSLYHLETGHRLPADTAIVCVGRCDFNQADGWRRVIIEKPFGHDRQSATALQRKLNLHLREDQIYRIDSLPRKVDGSTCVGISSRQINFGAHLESTLYRPRADHACGNGSSGHMSRLLR